MDEYYAINTTESLEHVGVKNMKWGRRRYQNEDGSLTPLGRLHYGIGMTRATNKQNNTKLGKTDLYNTLTTIYDQGEGHRVYRPGYDPRNEDSGFDPSAWRQSRRTGNISWDSVALLGHSIELSNRYDLYKKRMRDKAIQLAINKASDYVDKSINKLYKMDIGETERAVSAMARVLSERGHTNDSWKSLERNKDFVRTRDRQDRAAKMRDLKVNAINSAFSYKKNIDNGINKLSRASSNAMTEARLAPSYKNLYNRLKASGRVSSFNQFLNEVYYPDLERRR